MLAVYFFLMGAGVDVFITLPAAEAIYDGLAELSWPHFGRVPELISATSAAPFTIALSAWEITVAVLLLRSGRAVRVALC